MDAQLKAVLQQLNDANKAVVETMKELLAIVREHENRIAKLEQKNG